MSRDTLIAEFRDITSLTPELSAEFTEQLEPVLTFLQTRPILALEERTRRFLAHVNWKFRINQDALADFYREAAHRRITFNYHQKQAIQHAFDYRSLDELNAVLESRAVPAAVGSALKPLFTPAPPERTLETLRNECSAPSKLREYSKLRKERGNAGVSQEILQAQFGAFVFVSLPIRDMHECFDPDFDPKEYKESFWDELHTRAPHLFSRDHSLDVVYVDQQMLTACANLDEFRETLAECIQRSYTALNNYGYLAIYMAPLSRKNRSVTWDVVADATLFAEKHLESKLRKSYFQHERIRATTAEYVGPMPETAAFDVANEGFTYKDCFALPAGADSKALESPVLLLFQKNHRDETVVPCPTCRSANVQGNSYPSLGVRSWECNNLLCPDRSKYNRGKRYSFRGMVMQQAIEDPASEIPKEFVRRWSRDVQVERTLDDVFELVARHYSLAGDTIHLHNWPRKISASLGRRIEHHKVPPSGTKSLSVFLRGSFFQRFLHEKPGSAPKKLRREGTEDFTAYIGDSAEVLRAIPANHFDAAVTSPPYYNAREYSQWPNIYCYLYDMFNVNREVFRTLRPGALYYYNIFDYFDNENTLALSAMGQKRMILSAYTLDMFRRIGFECIGNVIWDKGEIEGKRGFNAGNFSPYYQAPFNCWEHVYAFRKPGPGSLPVLPAVLRQQAVVKMVRGENVHGHTAPFPDAIPELAILGLGKGACVLDPFGGSLTTGRVAARHGFRSVCVERSEEYVQLGLRLWQEEIARTVAEKEQLALFK